MRRIGASLIVTVIVTLLAFGAWPGGAQAAVSYSADEIEVVRLINEYRVSKGRDALLVSDLLSDSSTKHSLDMAKYGFFSHVSLQSDWFPAGANQRARAVACGYPSNATSVVENIAEGYGTAAQVFLAWKYSQTHNENMLSPFWKVVGVGLENGHWTTDFGTSIDGTAHENGGSAPPDTTPPTVSITSPGAGANVTGYVTVSVTAVDNLGVERVDLYAGGVLVATDNESPYAVVWDSTSLNPGAYTLQARGWDAAGNVGTTSCMVYVSSSPGVTTTTAGSTTTTASTTTTTVRPTTSTTTTSSTTTSTTVAAGSFADVPVSNTFYEPITVLAAAGVVSGYTDGLFYPANPVTRAQFTKIITLALDVHTPEIDNLSDPTFYDVAYTGGEYPFDFVEEAAALGIIKGFGDGSFSPGANVTRLQLALMLVRAGGDGLETPSVGYTCPFGDVPAYARESVGVAYYNGLLSGKTATRFDPYGSATRGQVAKMVYGLIEALKQ